MPEKNGAWNPFALLLNRSPSHTGDGHTSRRHYRWTREFNQPLRHGYMDGTDESSVRLIRSAVEQPVRVKCVIEGKWKTALRSLAGALRDCLLAGIKDLDPICPCAAKEAHI